MNISNLPALVLAFLGASIAFGAIFVAKDMSDKKFSEAMQVAAGAFMGAAGASQIVNKS